LTKLQPTIQQLTFSAHSVCCSYGEISTLIPTPQYLNMARFRIFVRISICWLCCATCTTNPQRIHNKPNRWTSSLRRLDV